ncbi:MAG: fused MFS/spermidine synthase [Deltaproteobacteria bacterium]|nr:fused MFS/spermidine synthase [Deltaproteobacteria bacterium]
MKYILYACFFLSGMAGLIYQVVWSKYFNLFLGATSYSTGILLSTFMGGLALGNHIFGKFVDRYKNPLRLYSYLEFGIGITCALFPLYFDTIFNLYFILASGSIPNTWGNIILKLIFSVMTILLPTTLMGGTLPVMSKFIIRQIREVGAKVGLLYFLNTVGAIIGTIIGGYFVIHTIGLDFSVQLFSFVNILIGVVTYYMSKSISEDFSIIPQQIEDTDNNKTVGNEEAYSEFQVRVVLVAIGISGFVSMVYEVVWTRMLALIIGSAVQSFAIMLFTFITGIAVGSYFIHKVLNRKINHLLWFAIIELFIAITIICALPLYMRLPYYFNVIGGSIPRTEAMFIFYEISKVIICFTIMFLPTFFIGMTLPLVSHINTKSITKLGIGVGDTFSINTLGNLVGSLVAGFIMLPTMGMEASMKTGIIINFIIAIILLFTIRVKALFKYLSLLLVILVGSLLFTYEFIDKEYIQRGNFRLRNRYAKSFEEFLKVKDHEDLIFFKEGKDAVVSVTKSPKGILSLRINGKPDASTGFDMPTQIWCGHIGVLLHPNPEDVFLLGMGSGVTGGVLATHEEIKNIELLEISKEVIEAAKLFKEENLDVLNNKKVRVINADGREYLKLNPQKKYDIIISEPSNPWMAGVANLFTVQYFEEVKSHLKENGIFVQWFQAYETNDKILNIMLNTFGRVFEYAYVFAPAQLDLLIVGSNKPIKIDQQRIAKKFKDPVFLSTIEDKHSLGIPNTIPEFVSMNMIGHHKFKTYYGKGEEDLIVNEDKFPIIEYEAPKAFFVGRTSNIISIIAETNVNHEYSKLNTKELIKDVIYKMNFEELLEFIKSCEARGQKQVARSCFGYILDYNLDKENIYIINNYAELLAYHTFLKNYPQSKENYSPTKCNNISHILRKYVELTTSIFYKSKNELLFAHIDRCLEETRDKEFLTNIQKIYFVLGETEKLELYTQTLLSSDSITDKEKEDALLLIIKHHYNKGNFEKVRELLANIDTNNIKDQEMTSIIKELQTTSF